jgi:hypothetical protein
MKMDARHLPEAPYPWHMGVCKTALVPADEAEAMDESNMTSVYCHHYIFPKSHVTLLETPKHAE